MGVEEFPLLNALGLYAADIRGDGNCLFNALSDQLYGHQDEHAPIRSRVIEYMREHADYYKAFIDVYPGGGIRRNPKRKNAGAYSSPVYAAPPSQADIDRVFESHLQSMAKGGTYGDNMEITAFSSAYNVDVKIYQRDFAYMVSGGGEDGARPVAHIAYHTWEHYSSIRNLDGPHSGPPQVAPKVLSPEEEAVQKEKLEQTPHVLPWQVDVVSKSLPYLADKPTIKRALEAAKGNIDLAVSNLLDAEEHASASSAQESSSVERDHDSDDETYDGPNKKQDRRMSRASRVHPPHHRDVKHQLSRIAQYDGSPESVDSSDSEASSVPASSSQQSAITLPTEADDDPPTKKESTPLQTESGAPPRIRLKLHPPKPPPDHQHQHLDNNRHQAGKTMQKQQGPRLSARDRKDIKKQAQKAARKERQQLAARGGHQLPDAAEAGLALRHKGMTETPPVETLRTLYI